MPQTILPRAGAQETKPLANFLINSSELAAKITLNTKSDLTMLQETAPTGLAAERAMVHGRVGQGNSTGVALAAHWKPVQRATAHGQVLVNP